MGLPGVVSISGYPGSSAESIRATALYMGIGWPEPRTEWPSICGIQEPHLATRYVVFKGNCGSGHTPLPMYVVCLIKVKDIGVRFSPWTPPPPSDWILLNPKLSVFLSGVNSDL